MTLAIIIPAAGASARMGGRDKLMEVVDGQPLLLRQVTRALATGAPVYVTTRADRPERITALDKSAARLVHVATPDEGLAASIRAGIAALPVSVSAAMILLPDLPDIDTSNMRAMITAHNRDPKLILRATTEDGTPGHPTVFPRLFFADLAKITGDRGAQALLKTTKFTPVPLQGHRALTDLDTPQDWKIWRARQR